MSRIVYENEKVEEVLTSGIIPLENRSKITGKIISVEEAIIEELKRENPDIDIENIRIETEGSYDVMDSDYGEDVYENQVVKYTVYQNVERKVPYKVEEELVDSGLLTESESALSNEEKDQVVFDILRRSNKFSGSEDDYSINYVGASDDFYDNPYEEYEVYRIVSKERLDEDKEFEKEEVKEEEKKDETSDSKEEDAAVVENQQEKEEDIETLKQALEELKDLRSKLEKLENVEERKNVIDELYSKQEKIEENAKNNEDSKDIDKELEDLDKDINKVQEEIKASAKEFEKLYDELQAILDEQRSKLENTDLLSEEELRDLLKYFDTRKLDVNGKSAKISNQIDEQRKRLTTLKNKKTKLGNDVNKASNLDVTYNQYKDITDEAINKKSTLEAIMDTKGLGDIADKKSKERTEEEQRIYAEAKKDIINEISEALKNSGENKAITDIIEALYPLERVQVKGKQKIIAISPEKINNIKSNISNMPEKIKSNVEENDVDYVPGKAPEDMLQSSALATGRVHIDDIYLRGLSSEEVEQRLKEEAIKDLEGRDDFEYNPEEMEIVLVGADVDEAASDIQYTRYEVVPKEKSKDDDKDTKPKVFTSKVLTTGRVFIDDIYLRGLSKEETEERYKQEVINDLASRSDFEYDPDKMDIVIVGAEVDEAASDIQYMRYEIVSKEEVKDDTPEPEPVIEDDDEKERDTIDLYRDVDTEDMYVEQEVLDRFGIVSVGGIVEVDDSKRCYRIKSEDANEIINNANNSEEPYNINIIDIYLRKAKEEDLGEPVVEKIVLYKDINTDEIYAKKYVVNRFELDTIGEVVRINNYACLQIDALSFDRLLQNADNPVSPYEIEIEEVDLGKKLPIPVPGPTPEPPKKPEDDEDKKPQPPKKPDDDEDKKPQPPKKPDDDEDKKPQPPKKPDDDEEEHVIRLQPIIQKLTENVNFGKRDGKRYYTSNIKVSKDFANELRSGNYLYNVVHVVGGVAKAGIQFLRKISSKLLLSKKGKEAVQEIIKRFDELSEEEKEFMFIHYRGSELKTQMNFSLDDIILPKLKEYGMSKVEALNSKIKENYTLLFSLLGEIKAIEELLVNPKTTDAERKKLNAERKKLMSLASEAIQNIEKDRNDANNLLSGGVHGLEEDFKAMSTKMNYVGLRFTKKHKFDHELQKKLAEHDQALGDAIHNGDDEAVVSNFMAIESLYYKNTKISNSIVGKRSVGTKYYTPLAEEFNYNNDPFIRDLFMTIAVTSAVVSAVNAVRVHKIESDEILKQQQADVNKVNASNDAVMDQVHQVGRDIEGHRGVFQKGMEAQGRQDVLNASNTLERGALDYHDWSFGKSYRAMDDANHEFYNAFSNDVTSQINGITSRYGSGAINQAQALQEMANVVRSSQSTLTSVVDECLAILKPYAQTHPQFDLTAVQDAMEYIVANPTAIAQMNQGMVEVTDLASGLAGLSVEHAAALSELPSDMVSTLVCAASATALAANVSSSMNSKYGNARRYGNEITDMMGEYLASEEQDTDERTR